MQGVWPKSAGARSAGLSPIAGHYDPSSQDHSLLRAGHLAEKRNLRSEPRYHGRKRVSEPGRGQRASERSCSPQRVRVSLRTCVREGAGGRSRPPLVTRSARWPPAADVHAPSPCCTRATAVSVPGVTPSSLACAVAGGTRPRGTGPRAISGSELGPGRARSAAQGMGRVPHPRHTGEAPGSCSAPGGQACTPSSFFLKRRNTNFSMINE